jgi:hypothetical protein
VVLLESSIRSKIDTDLGTVVANTIDPIVKTKGRIVFKVIKTQKQSSCVCGYFALANAATLCYGLDPETLVFDQKKLIEHFIQIVYEGKPLSMFPYKLKKVYNTNHMYLHYKLPN